MDRRRLVIAAIVAAGLVLLAVATEVVLPRVTARRDDERRLLLPAGATLDAFTVQARGARLRLARTPPAGAWTVTTDDGKSLTADARAADMVVTALRGTRIAADVTEATPAELASRGLDAPRAVLSWTTPAGRSWTLALGKPVVGGQVSAATDGRIVLVPERVLLAADNGLDHFRAKRLAAIDADQVERLDFLRRKDQVPEGSSLRIVLERSATGDAPEDAVIDWKLVEPLGVPANAVRIASLLSRLASLEALGFGAEAPSPEDLARTGLAEPAATVLVSLTGGRTVSIVIGDPSPDKHAWARIDDGPIVQLRQDIARDALLADDFWRDNRVVKLPKWRIVNVRLKKGAEAGIDVEIAREPGAPWRLVRPGDAEVGPSEGDQFVEALLDLQCGRFEDELAADPSRLDARWDFDAPGSLDLEALALLPDGTPRRSNCELTPFVRDRAVYFAVRSIDEMGRVEACVAEDKAVDKLLDKARVLASLGKPAPSAPQP